MTEALPADAAAATARLLRLGIPPDALVALATALERQAERQQPGRTSFHVDCPPSGRPAGALVESVDGEGPRFLCRGKG